MNQLSFPKQVQVISLLTEGMSIRSIERLTGTNRNTIMRLGKQVGDACARLHHAQMRHLQVSCLELDETWSFVCKKQKNLQDHDPAEYGDTYLWIAFDIHTKLIVSYLVGKRSAACAQTFMLDIRKRIINRPHITTDAFLAYPDAIEAAFAGNVDYVMQNKKGGGYPTQVGNPDLSNVTTNHVERVNLTIRTQLRRHTRKTSGHSKKLENHEAAIALLIAYYNFCRVHESLCVTPAMEYGLTRTIWSVADLIREAEATPTEIEPLPDVVPPPPPGLLPGRRRFKLYVGGLGRKGRVS